MLRLALAICLAALALPAAAQSSGATADVATALQADQDSRINVSVRLASDAQAYYLKPSAFGGGDGSFDGISLSALEYRVNEKGYYVRRTESGAVHTFTLRLRDGVVTITAASDQAEGTITTVVTGPTVQDISVTY